jgi:hypothetical protein
MRKLLSRLKMKRKVMMLRKNLKKFTSKVITFRDISAVWTWGLSETILCGLGPNKGLFVPKR